MDADELRIRRTAALEVAVMAAMAFGFYALGVASAVAWVSP